MMKRFWAILVCSLLIQGCMGLSFFMRIPSPAIQQNPLKTSFVASYSLGGYRPYWGNFSSDLRNGICGYWYTHIGVYQVIPFTDGVSHLLPQYYEKFFEAFPERSTSKYGDHHLAFNAISFDRNFKVLGTASPENGSQPGLVRVELEMEVVMTDHTGGPGFAKRYKMQAEGPVVDMSHENCERYDKQGELSSKVMEDFFAQFQTDLVAYLNRR